MQVLRIRICLICLNIVHEGMREREGMLEGRFLEIWPYPISTYEPKKMLPEFDSLDSGADFTNRKIAAFNFMGVRYTVTQWNKMLVKVLQLLYELEPAKLHLLVEETSYPASAFRESESPDYSKIADCIYVRTASSTAAKIDLLQSVFSVCGIDQSDLVFEIPVGSSD